MQDLEAMTMRARISLRVSTHLWLDERRREELLPFLKNYADTIEEVAFFTAFTHSLATLSLIQERAAALGDIIPRFKSLGLSVGVNHLSTVGHLDENLPNSLNEPWQRMMDIEGKVSLGCYCPADPEVQAYIAACYRALAKAKPDFIWIDDDVRLIGHGPVGYVCFCDRCLANFSAETGRPWSRETLKAAFNGGPVEDQLAIRKRWLEHNRRLIVGLLSGIRAAVDAADPAIVLGMMTGDRFYDGSAFDEYARALAGPRDLKVMWRPGAGFYGDQTPVAMLDKAHSMGRQTTLLPATVTDIQSEIENFPYQRLRKSAHITATEVAAYNAAGCTGAALNVMGLSPDPFDEYLPLFEGVRKLREFYDKQIAAFGRRPCEGLWAATNRDYFATVNLGRPWFGPSRGPGPNAILEIGEIGLPIAYSREGAAVTVLAGDSCRAFSKEELLDLLSGGVMLDAPALSALNDRGLSEYTGFEVAGEHRVDTLEVFGDDGLNGRFVGWVRDCRPSFWPETAYTFKPLRPECRVLSEVCDFEWKRAGAATAIFENRLGGRVAVCGYYPWRWVFSLAKTSQLKALCRWLSRDTLLAYVASYEKASLWCRRDSAGHSALLLLNTSLDTLARLVMHVRDGGAAMALTRTDCSSEVLARSGYDGPYAIYETENLKPWEVVLLTQEG